MWSADCTAAVEAARKQVASVEKSLAKARVTTHEGGLGPVVELKHVPPKFTGEGLQITIARHEGNTTKPGWVPLTETTSTGYRMFLQRNTPHGHAYIDVHGWPPATAEQLALPFKAAVDRCLAD